MTTEISGEKYPTLSMIIPLIRGLQHEIKSQRPTSQTGMDLQFQLLEVISRRLGQWESNKMVAKATFLDPRFRKTAFGVEDNASTAQRWVTEDLELLAKRNKNNKPEKIIKMNRKRRQRCPQEKYKNSKTKTSYECFLIKSQEC